MPTALGLPAIAIRQVLMINTSLVCLSGGLTACLRERREESEVKSIPRGEQTVQAQNQQSTLDAVQRLFQPDSQEAAYLDSALAVIQQSYSLPGSPLAGELRRFDVGSMRRYLLAGRVWDSVTAKAVIRFFVLEPSSSISGPSPVLVEDEIDRFAVDSIADFDRNGFPDIGYCVWLGKRGTRGEWRALEFREKHWHSVGAPALRARGCEPQAEP
jgi:hypothetical protein